MSGVKYPTTRHLHRIIWYLESNNGAKYRELLRIINITHAKKQNKIYLDAALNFLLKYKIIKIRRYWRGVDKYYPNQIKPRK